MTIKNRKVPGGLSLEAALCMPLLLFLLLAFLQVLNFQRSELIFREALDYACEETSLALKAAESLALDLAPDEGRAFLRRLFPDERYRQLLNDYLSTAVLQLFLEARVQHWRQHLATRYGWTLAAEEHAYRLRWEQQGPALQVLARLKQRILGLPQTVEIHAYIPFWTRYSRAELAKQDQQVEETKEEDVWTLDNFSRGRFFRQHYGANLDQFYPSIQYFADGLARRIKSYDLTAPSYAAADYLEKRVAEDISILADFQSGPGIQAGMVRERELLIVVPRNSPPALWARLQAQQAEAAARGVRLRLEQYGEHRR